MRYLFIVLFLAGCASSRAIGSGGPRVEDPSAGASLISMGETFLWVGGIALVAGLLACIWLKGVGALIAEAGGVTLIAGISFIWLGDNVWAIIAILALAALAFLFRHRSRIFRWLRLGKVPLPQTEDK
jgi:hypothetical protein